MTRRHARDRRRLARRHRRDRPRRRRRGDLEPAPHRAWAPPFARGSPRPATAATTPPSTSTATASTTRPTSSACSSPVARGRAEYVVGSRFLGDRDGMSWHRTLANRLTSALLGTLMETVVSDGQSGYRAFGRRALAEARIRHDYNYAQVLTLSLWGAGIDPVEVPIDYRRRQNGRSFVRYPEYFARVAPALWREFRHARKQRATSPAADRARHGVRHRAVVEQREDGLERPPRRVGPAGGEPAAAPAHVGVEPDRGRRRPSSPSTAPVRGKPPHPPRDQRDREQQPRRAGAAAGTRSRTSWGRGTRRRAAARRARARRGARPTPRARAAGARGRAPRGACARASRRPRPRAANTGAQRSSPNSRSMNSATSR